MNSNYPFLRAVSVICLFCLSVYAQGEGKKTDSVDAIEASKASSLAEQIERNSHDKRKYDYFVLENGLKVLLISDKSVEKSAASLDVWVGSGEDPKDRNGLAHFLEHMLFLGTEKYPVAGEFQDFIAGHGGRHNAYTSLTHTNYFFDIETERYGEALDRFAQFFIAPRFDEKYVERERNAVHSEFRAKYTDDYRRTRDVFRTLVPEDHSLSVFSVGNLDTLAVDQPRSLRKDLLSFYDQYYSANRMALVLISSEPVEKLRAWVNESFVDIENRNVDIADDTRPIFKPETMPAELKVVPTKETRRLSYMFPVPDLAPYYKTKPSQYIGHLIGHEAKGSLLSVYKKAGWATGLSAGAGGYDWRGGDMFSVNILLTEEGLENIPSIEALLFSYIKTIKKKGVNAWRYDELARMGSMAFEYGDKVDPFREVLALANNLHYVDVKDVLRADFLYQKYDESSIRKFLSYLNSDNVLKIVTAPGLQLANESEYYQTPYSIAQGVSISQECSSKTCTSLKKRLSLPKKNNFIPGDFSLANKAIAESNENTDSLSKAENQPSPEIVFSTENSRAWYAPDVSYQLPKAFIRARYKLPAVAQSKEAYAATLMYTEVLNEYLNETAYMAAMGGLSYSLQASPRGLNIEFVGYSDSLGELFTEVTKTIRKYNSSQRFRKKLNEQYFAKVKTERLRRQKNRRYQAPYRQLYGEVPAALYTPYWGAREVEKAVAELSQSDLDRFIKTIFDASTSDVFVYGNYSSRDAKRFLKALSGLPKTSKKNSEKGKVVKLEQVKEADMRGYVAELEVDHQDNALVLYSQGLGDSMNERVKMSLLEQMLSTPFFNTLRTEKQLGYIVFLRNYPIRDVPGLLAIVQSPNTTPDQILKYMDEFLTAFENDIEINFERDKKAVMEALMENAKTQRELVQEFWGSILVGDHQFDEKERMKQALEKVQLEEMKSYYKKVLLDSNRRLLFTTNSENLASQGYKPIQQYDAYKNKLPSYIYP